MGNQEAEAQTRVARALADEGDDIAQLVVIFAAVVDADGKVDGLEKARVKSALEEVFASKLAPGISNHVLHEGLRAVDELGVEAAVEKAAKRLAAFGVLRDALVVALGLARVSEGLDPRERAVLLGAAAAGGLSEDELPSL